mmetsp:Transcript_4449/g.14410  ORF Transcript_4449/g.14410 Transcript_4449/m.14410 type:complete len:229 (+) Transcript_4449:746-1432(+)
MTIDAGVRAGGIFMHTTSRAGSSCGTACVMLRQKVRAMFSGRDRDRCMIGSSARRSPRTKCRSAARTASGDAVSLTVTATSAACSAGTLVTSLPTTTATCPRACSSATSARLSCGLARAKMGVCRASTSSHCSLAMLRTVDPSTETSSSFATRSFWTTPPSVAADANAWTSSSPVMRMTRTPASRRLASDSTAPSTGASTMLTRHTNVSSYARASTELAGSARSKAAA